VQVPPGRTVHLGRALSRVHVGLRLL
jgi:hypothetical protein